MKIYAINGSPRKKCNSAQMLQSFVDGVKSIKPDADIEYVSLYDYKYTGCKSCFACQRKENREHLCCHIHDDIHDILDGAFHADGLVFATPIYFFDITAQLKAFLERLMYPGVSEKKIPTAFIYTMNASKQTKQELNFEASLSTSKRFLEWTFHDAPESIYAFNTFQYNDSDDFIEEFKRYLPVNKACHDVQFPIDCQNAFDAGIKMAKKILILQSAE
jgi:multimeric flavodoxin WrbA